MREPANNTANSQRSATPPAQKKGERRRPAYRAQPAGNWVENEEPASTTAPNTNRIPFGPNRPQRSSARLFATLRDFAEGRGSPYSIGGANSAAA
eukprot:scaffold3599_cov32-Tisochrysis_lutea.AAC.1